MAAGTPELRPGRIDRGGGAATAARVSARPGGGGDATRGEAMRSKRREDEDGEEGDKDEMGGGNATTPYAFLTVAVSGLGTARWRGLWFDGWVLLVVEAPGILTGASEVNFELRRTAGGVETYLLDVFLCLHPCISMNFSCGS